MKCTKVKTLIPPYADNALSGNERSAFEQHLSMCDECKAEMLAYSDKLERLNSLIAHSYNSCPEYPDVAANVISRLQEQNSAGQGISGWLCNRRALSTASAFAVLSLVLTLALTALFYSLDSTSRQAPVDIRSGRQSAYIARPLEGGCVDASVSSRRFAHIESPRTRWAR